MRVNGLLRRHIFDASQQDVLQGRSVDGLSLADEIRQPEIQDLHRAVVG